MSWPKKNPSIALRPLEPPTPGPLPGSPEPPGSPPPGGGTPSIDWIKANEIYRQDLPVSLQVVGYNRGGLLVSGEGLQGFVPVSHLVDLSGCKMESEADQQLAEYVGRTLELKIIECDAERGRVVYSERAALSKARAAAITCSRCSSPAIASRDW